MKHYQKIPALFLLALTACATSKPAPPRIADTPDSASDLCALNMQDIAGSMLIYYNAHQKLPDTLQALAQATHTPLDTTCPTSHEPYIYIPTGLSAPNQSRLLVLYDATPVHDGLRWGVTIDPTHVPITTDVIHLDQPVLDVYLKSR